MAELGPVAHRGVDVDAPSSRRQHVLAEGDRARSGSAGVGPVAVKNESLRITVPSPMVSRSVQTGTCGRGSRRLARPSRRAPAGRATYSGEPTNRTSGLRRTSVLTIQKRTYARLQMRISLGLPATDQDPLGQDREGAQEDEQRAAEDDRPQVDVDARLSRPRSTRSPRSDESAAR